MYCNSQTFDLFEIEELFIGTLMQILINGQYHGKKLALFFTNIFKYNDQHTFFNYLLCEHISLDFLDDFIDEDIEVINQVLLFARNFLCHVTNFEQFPKEYTIKLTEIVHIIELQWYPLYNNQISAQILGIMELLCPND